VVTFRKSLPPSLVGEFNEYKDIKSLDRIAVAAWIGFVLSVLLLPLDYSRIKSGEFYTHEPYRYLFYFHLFGLIFLLPAYSMTFHKPWIITTRLRRGIHIWGMVVLTYAYLFGMGIVVFWDRDSLIIYMSFIFISSWMFAMSHKERLLFILTTLPPMFLIILLKPSDQVSYDKITMIYEIIFLSVVALIFDTFDYNLRVSNFLALKKNEAAEYENRVEAMMLQQFTSIHPAIHWRFREEAVHLLHQSKKQEIKRDIVFEDVYPFYGSLDIRNSSGLRQKAIAQDLLLNLELALSVLHQSHDLLSFDILGELISEAEKHRDKIITHFSSGDEAGIAGFIRTDISPVIDHLRKNYSQLEAVTQNYQEACAETGICTQYRKGYEEALSMVNRHMFSILDSEEQGLQRLYPCYFEKALTDGLEYNIYAGSSIANGRQLDPLYLDNIRLRQLLWTCEIIKNVDDLQPQIKQRLNPHAASITESGETKVEQQIEIAPLILAYITPITLKFRSAEKRLDVFGSYSIRYEMLKKRIDKAVISGTGERLTKPGFISMVYSQDEEKVAYEKHLHYLLKKNLILPEWEPLALEPMPGAEGIKALRVRVRTVSREL
jgi:hypothetical protein